ncbi:MAG: RecQ family ATP-dependent DNA helicase, partial [Bacteroidetes bacterium]|nr:RecQ family ATP-dependent DNA helicase [Bacteroidota bacterium]
GGKSLCFQIPAMVFSAMESSADRRPLTLVISPLIALMKDQVERLNQLGIAATYVNSSMSRNQIDHKLQGAMDGVYKFLYLAPERINSEMFRMRLPKMNVNFLVVDEAHCISQWGYDFRPSYLEIAAIREIKPNLKVIALTASATPLVKQDIQDKLEMQKPRIFTKSFRRDNLRYFVIEEENVVQRILNIATRTQGTGIVYARTRKLTEKLAGLLKDKGISAAAYHGGMLNSERSQIQQAWIDNKHRIIVATNAFGMGIDKPDVRFVVHHNLPFDLESYDQEAGRGGRDGQTALAIAFKSSGDIYQLKRWSEEKYPTWDQLVHHYHVLCNFFHIPNKGDVSKVYPLVIKELVKASGDSAISLYNSLRILHQEGILLMDEERDDYGYIQFIAPPNSVLIYKEHHPQLAELIDFMLRMLGGETYLQEVKFLPLFWTRILDINLESLEQKLRRLESHELITYTPPSSEPSIQFLSPRHSLTRKELNWDKYDFLRKQNAIRLKEMLAYIDTKEICRSLFIQNYFGEQSHTPCGKCDVCIGRHKTKVNDDEFKDIHQALINYVKSGKVRYRDVLTNVTVGSPAQREKVLKYLMDKEVILADGMGWLRLGGT